MLFYVHYQDKEYRVRVESRNNQIFVKFLDGPDEAIDLNYFGHDVSFLQDDKVFSANVVGGGQSFTVFRPEGNLSFTVESEYKRIVGSLRGQDLQSEFSILSKMPGKITKVQVKVGDKLEKGQPVLVMEAMKMENEVRATVAGEVVSILVKEGQAVETGAHLVELKPLED